MMTMKMRISRWLRSFIHNSIVHPLLPFLPSNWAESVHDVNGEWAFSYNMHDPSKILIDTLIWNYMGKRGRVSTSKYDLYAFQNAFGSHWLVVVQPGATISVHRSAAYRKFALNFSANSVGLSVNSVTINGAVDFVLQDDNWNTISDNHSVVEDLYVATITNCTSSSRSFEFSNG